MTVEGHEAHASALEHFQGHSFVKEAFRVHPVDGDQLLVATDSFADVASRSP